MAKLLASAGRLGGRQRLPDTPRRLRLRRRVRRRAQVPRDAPLHDRPDQQQPGARLRRPARARHAAQLLAVDLKLTTARLELVAATVDHLGAELTNRPQFAAMLDARVSEPWPPPLNDEDSANWAIAYLQDHPDAVGWSMWYFVLLDDGRRTAIGNGGFKGRPDAEGTTEIGYSIVEAHQRHGYASEAVAALIAWAFQHPRHHARGCRDLPGVSRFHRCYGKERSAISRPGLRGARHPVRHYAPGIRAPADENAKWRR